MYFGIDDGMNLHQSHKHNCGILWNIGEQRFPTVELKSSNIDMLGTDMTEYLETYTSK